MLRQLSYLFPHTDSRGDDLSVAEPVPCQAASWECRGAAVGRVTFQTILHVYSLDSIYSIVYIVCILQ